MRYILDLDFKNFQRRELKQFDNEIIEIEVVRSGQPFSLVGYTAELHASNSKGQAVIQTENITIANNLITIPLIEDITRVSGEVKLEVQLTKSGKKKTTFTFKLLVNQSVLEGANLQPSIVIDIIEVLENKITLAQQVKKDTEQLIQSGGAATKGEVQTLTSQLADIVTYNVVQHPLFDIEDISKAINDIIPKLKENDNVLLPNIPCKFKNTINLTNIPNGVNIDFRGTIIQNGSLDKAILFSGIKAKLTINKLVGNTNITDGLVLGGATACYDNIIRIGQISGFRSGILLNPTGVNGVQYNEIHFKNIEKCVNGILFDCIADSWANENTFYGGSIGDLQKITQYGLKFVNGNVVSDIGYNNNKFYNIGFEGISNDGITLHNSKWNSFINCRMLESISGRYIVEDSTLNNGNLFIFSAILPIEKILLTSSMIQYIGTLAVGSGLTYKYNGFYIDDNKSKHFITTNSSYSMSDTNGVKTYEPYFSIMDLNSSQSALNIKISKDLDYEGNEITFKVSDYLNAINIYSSDGTTLLTNVRLNKTGLFKVRKINNVWRSFRIDYDINQLEALYSSATDTATLISDFKKLCSDLRAKGYMKS